MEFNLAICFKGHPFVEKFGIGIFPGLGIIRFKSSEFLWRVNVNGKTAAIDQRLFRIGIATKGQDVSHFSVADFDGNLVAEDKDIEVIRICVSFALGRDGITDVVLVKGRFSLGDIETLHTVEEIFKDIAAGLQGSMDEGVVGIGIVDVDDDAASRSHIGDAVDENQFAQDFVMAEG